jgi:predicted lipoprotein with Yx(FWY)xxD motif
MNIKHSFAAAAVIVTAAVPAGLLVAEASARGAVDPAATPAKTPTVSLRMTSLGSILVAGVSGRTLYLSDRDGKNKSNCLGGCGVAWPPLLASAKPSAGKGVAASKLGEIRRGSSHQVTYAGHPLYEFSGDTNAGQTTGEGVNGFYVVSASGKAIK